MLLSCVAMLFAFNVEAADYVLLHGMGQKGGGADKAVKYWGGHESGGHCTKRSWGRCKKRAPKSYHPASYLPGSKHVPMYDSTNNGLTSGWLQRTYVNEARKGKKVIAHSMGNPTLVHACYSGKGCVNFRNSQGPLLGSDAADNAHKLCNIWGIGAIVDLIGYCTPAVYTLRTTNGYFHNSAYRNNIKKQTQKSFCGYDYSTWRNGNSVKMRIVSNTMIGGQDDGLVPYWSCAYGNKVSRVKCDHEQGTGRSDNCGNVKGWMR